MKIYIPQAEITGFIVCEKNEQLSSVDQYEIEAIYILSKEKRLIAIETKRRDKIVLSLNDEEFDAFKAALGIDYINSTHLSEFYSQGNYFVFDKKHLAERFRFENGL